MKVNAFNFIDGASVPIRNKINLAAIRQKLGGYAELSGPKMHLNAMVFRIYKSLLDNQRINADSIVNA